MKKNEKQDILCAPSQYCPISMSERRFSFSVLLSFCLHWHLSKSLLTPVVWLCSGKNCFLMDRIELPKKLQLNSLLVYVKQSWNLNTRVSILFFFLRVLHCSKSSDFGTVIPASYYANDMVTRARIWCNWWNVTSVRN